MENKRSESEYVYVEEDGTVRELENDEVEYLNSEFEPTDGARPYIKSSFYQLTLDNKVWGFILREKVPKNIKIKSANKKYLEARTPISIYDSGKTIFLTTGNYSIKVLGGWNVSLGNFTITLKYHDNDDIFNPEITKWRFQSYELGERAKKIMNLDILKTGKYKIEFGNPEGLRVKRSNLILKSFFTKEISNKELKVWIG